MNGNKYLFDTNALIAFFQGHSNLRQHSSSIIYLSVISVIEFLSFGGINEKDKKLLNDFLSEVEVIDIKKR